MIVGFTIKDFQGHLKEAYSFIRRMDVSLNEATLLAAIQSPSLKVNVFPRGEFDSTDLRDLPCQFETINVARGVSLITSLTAFPIELPYSGGILRMGPMEYRRVDEQTLNDVHWAIEQNLIRVISTEGLPSLYVVWADSTRVLWNTTDNIVWV